MNTTETRERITLAKLCEQSNIPDSLIRAVVRQMGGWESFTETARDICLGGIDGGFTGFIYNRETKAFAKRNRASIADLAESQAQEFGSDIFTMIKGFGCLKNDGIETGDIASALFGGKEREMTGTVLNALAWYAGEEVSREYCRLADPDNY